MAQSTASNSLNDVVKKGHESQPLTASQQKSWTSMIMRKTAAAMKSKTTHNIMTQDMGGNAVGQAIAANNKGGK